MARVAVGIWLALSLATTFVSAATFAGCVSALPPDAMKLAFITDCVSDATKSESIEFSAHQRLLAHPLRYPSHFSVPRSFLLTPQNFCSTMGFSYSYGSGGECWCSTFSPQIAVYQSYAPATGCPVGSFTVSSPALFVTKTRLPSWSRRLTTWGARTRQSTPPRTPRALPPAYR